jgi:chorismate mutase/prephenate dehydratase
MLDELRKNIDAIDTEILTLLNRRAAVARKIGTIKLKAGLLMVDRDREVEVIRRIVRENEGVLADEAAARIYSTIIAESRQIQIDLAESVAYSGQI